MYSLGNNTLTSISYRGWNCQTLCWRSGSWVPPSAQQNQASHVESVGTSWRIKDPVLTWLIQLNTSGICFGPSMLSTGNLEYPGALAQMWETRTQFDKECAFKHVGILQMTLPICNSAIVISAKWTGFIFFHFDFWGVFEFSHLQVGNFNFHQMMICFQSVYLIVLSSAHYFSRQWYKDKLQNNRLDSL